MPRSLAHLHRDASRRAVVDVYSEHGAPILSPHHVADPPSPAVAPRDRRFAAPAAPDGVTH